MPRQICCPPPNQCGSACGTDATSEIKLKILENKLNEKIIKVEEEKQDKLIPGDFINIDEENVISVVLEAHDIGAITEDDAKQLINDSVNKAVNKKVHEALCHVEVDGGWIGG